MLVVEDNTTQVNWSLGMPINPLSYAGDVVIVIDPGKTNMAVILSTPDKRILKILEFSGNNRSRGPVMDTSVYCEEVRAFLREYLSNVKLYIVAIEEAVTYKKGDSPYNYHHSNLVLTEIRSNVLNFFLENFGIRVVEINNWSWKSHSLPEGYRSVSEKGSKRMFEELLPEFPYKDYYKADVTDCICILWYVCDVMCRDYVLVCNRREQCLGEYTYTFVPANMEMYKQIPEFQYNSKFTLHENLSYYANRVYKPFSLIVDTGSVEIGAAYGHSSWFKEANLHDTEVRVVAVRK